MQTELQKRLNTRKMVLLVEIRPPQSGDPEVLKSVAGIFAGKVCALGISDNKDHICMSSLAASAIVANAGVEPVMHMVTRDKNRIALVSDYLGAQSLGIRNVLLTSGTHQSLRNYKKAKNVFDIDSVQLIHILANLSNNGKELGEQKIEDVGPSFLGATADPFADPIEMHIIKLSKKINAGAQFIITKPVFSVERFKVWWEHVTTKKLNEKAAFIAGIRVFISTDEVQQCSRERPDPLIPRDIIERMSSSNDPVKMKNEGITIALDTIKVLSRVKGLRGFEITSEGNYSSALAVIDRLKSNGKGLEIT